MTAHELQSPRGMHYAAVLAVAVTAGACTHDHRATIPPIGTRVRVETADNVSRDGTVTLHNGHVVIVDRTDQPIATGRIVRMTSVDRHRGALEGLAIGAATGAAIGAVVGYAGGDDECSEGLFGCFLTFTAKEKAFIAGSLLGMAGGLSGAIIGVLVGSRSVYSVDTSREMRVMPVGPPGSVAGATVRF